MLHSRKATINTLYNMKITDISNSNSEHCNQDTSNQDTTAFAEKVLPSTVYVDFMLNRGKRLERQIV